MATVLAVRSSCSNLLHPVSLTPVAAPLLALYEVEVPADAVAHAQESAADEELAALVLKDAVLLKTDTSELDAVAADDDPSSLLLVPGPAPAPLRNGRPASATPVDAPRALHFRVYSAIERDAVDEELGAPQQFELLGCCSVLASDLARASRSGGALELPLRHSLAPLVSQTLRRAATTLTLRVRPASAAEQSEERVFERLMQLAHGEPFQGLPPRVHTQETSHQALVCCTLVVKNLPAEAVPAEEEQAGAAAATTRSVYLAAVFERDVRSGSMKLQGVTPWTHPAVAAPRTAAAAPSAARSLRFPLPGINLDFFSGEGQQFQVSLYRIRASQLRRAREAGGDATSGSTVPASLWSLLREEERVGSCEFQLDFFGLESALASSRRQSMETSVQPVIIPREQGRLSASSSSPHQLDLTLYLRHDISRELDESLQAARSAVVVSVDTAQLRSMKRRPDVGVEVRPSSPTKRSRATSVATAAERNGEAVPAASPSLLASASVASTSPGIVSPGSPSSLQLPSDALPDAPDVDVSSCGDDVPPSAALAASLLDMMRIGQSFRVFSAKGVPPVWRRVCYRAGSSDAHSPGRLVQCAVDSSSSEAAEDTVGVDLADVSDIFLGQQDAAFQSLSDRTPLGGPDDEDDGLSLSLVAAEDTRAQSMHLQARTPQQRAAWIVAIMHVLKQDEDDGVSAESTGEQQKAQPEEAQQTKPPQEAQQLSQEVQQPKPSQEAQPPEQQQDTQQPQGDEFEEDGGFDAFPDAELP